MRQDWFEEHFNTSDGLYLSTKYIFEICQRNTNRSRFQSLEFRLLSSFQQPTAGVCPYCNLSTSDGIWSYLVPFNIATKLWVQMHLGWHFVQCLKVMQLSRRLDGGWELCLSHKVLLCTSMFYNFGQILGYE